MSSDAVAAPLVVLGLGNPMRGDDAAGLKVAEAVEHLLRERPLDGVAVRTSTRAGFDLIDLLAGSSLAIVVDCLILPNPIPGRVRRLTPDDFAGSARLAGAHAVSLADALTLATATGVPMPSVVEVYGIEAAETGWIDDRLSPAVAAAIPGVAREVHARLLAAAAAGLPGPAR